MSDVVGRDVELGAGRELLERSRHGLALLLLEGDAGVGKTTVWSAVVAEAREEGRLVLEARPAAAEAELTLATLSDLLGEVSPDEASALPGPQRRALDVALLRVEADRASRDTRLLGTAVRSLLEALARTRPVLIAIDDIQWVDPTSAAVLAFAARRLGDHRVGMIGARRSTEPMPESLAALAGSPAARTIRVGPLSVAALHHVLSRHLDRPVARSTLIRVHQASGGFPLFALEIIRLLDEVGVPPAGEPLPVPGDVRELVRRRILQLPSGTRDVLLASALLGTSSADTIKAALGRPIDEDLETAARHGIAFVVDGRIRFEHPLFAAAIPATATEADRREAHARLAAAVDGADVRARHLALAATTPSAGVAADLEDAAHQAASRGGPGAAAELMELALRSTPPSDDAACDRRVLELAGILQRAGDPSRAERLLAGLIDTSASPGSRARARLALATIRYERDAAGSALALCEAAMPDASDDAELLARAHAIMAAVSWDDFRRREGHVQEALRLLDGVAQPDPVVLGLVLMERCEDDVATGRPLDPAVVERALELERVSAAPSVSDRFSASLGTWLKYQDDFDGARTWLEATLRAVEEEGDEGSLPYALSHLPELELWTGDWGAAEHLARRHLKAATDLGLESQRRQALYNLALVHVHQGRDDEARAEIADALAAAAEDGDTWTRASMLPLLGHLELSLGNAGAAVGHLAVAGELRDAVGQTAPRRQDADLVESLVATGDLEGARMALAAMEGRAARFARHSPLANAARARGLVRAATGDLDGAVAALDLALTEHELAPIAFDRARTLLVLGRVRRRRRERTAAGSALREAADVFEALGARAWGERARADLARVGVRRSSGSELTDTERRVAELAASGMTNREVAAALFLSPKTVEANLARAYGKLGIGSRAELGALLGHTPLAQRGDATA